MIEIFNTTDIFRENAKKLITMINGHKEDNYKEIQEFLREGNPIDYGLLLQLLDNNRLFGMFWDMMDGFDQYGIDVSTLILISKIAKASSERYRLYNSEIEKIFSHKEDLINQCIFMKGYPLNHYIYKTADFYNTRQFSDVDLVINPEYNESLKELMIQNGYSIKEKPNGMNATKVDESKIWSPQLSFDIHSGNPSKLKYTDRKETWEVFNSNKMKINLCELNLDIWTCNTEMHFLMTSNHLFEHTQRFVNILILDDLRWNRLIDLELLANEINIKKVNELAIQLEWQNALYYIDELIRQLDEDGIKFPNLKNYLSNRPMIPKPSTDIIQNIIMPDGRTLYWDISLKKRILEPRRALYVKNLLSNNNDVSDWYNLNQGGMYHKKLKKFYNQE